MNTQIKIDLDQAAEYSKLGYTVTCFVSIPKLQPKGRRANNKVIQKDALYTYNITGSPVAKGNYKAIWDKTRQELWGKDVRAKYTRQFIENALTGNGLALADKSMFAFLANKKRIIIPAVE